MNHSLAKAINNGWRTSEIAHACGVTPSAVRLWKNGGTVSEINAEKLSTLPSKPTHVRKLPK